MSYPKPPVPCPYCKELIHPDAKRCKHCHAETVLPKPKQPALLAKLNTFRVGFFTGLGVALALALAIYLLAIK